MKKYNTIAGLALGVVFASFGYAAAITDGTLTLNISSTGEINQISINGTQLDSSSFFQQYLLPGVTTFAGGSAVAVNGQSATYTATGNGLNISVTSQLLGPATGLAASGILRQTLVFTNNTGAGIALSLLSDSDQDLNNTADGDTVRYSPTQRVVYATESNQLYAVFAAARPGTFGFDVALLANVTYGFPTGNHVGPVTGDTEMIIGYDAGTLGAGQSTTFTFDYLFALNAQGLPGDFGASDVPEPATWMLLGGGLGVLGFLRRRSR